MLSLDFPGGSVVKSLPADAGDAASFPLGSPQSAEWRSLGATVGSR